MNISEEIKKAIDELSTEYRFVCTCTAYPEQYEVFAGKRQVGYMRIRGGPFRVDYPDVGGVTIYETIVSGDEYGLPLDKRVYYLQEAVDAIKKQESLLIC